MELCLQMYSHNPIVQVVSNSYIMAAPVVSLSSCILESFRSLLGGCEWARTWTHALWLTSCWSLSALRHWENSAFDGNSVCSEVQWSRTESLCVCHIDVLFPLVGWLIEFFFTKRTWLVCHAKHFGTLCWTRKACRCSMQLHGFTWRQADKTPRFSRGRDS